MNKLNNKITCECGSTITASSLKRHLTTKKHNKNIKNNQEREERRERELKEWEEERKKQEEQVYENWDCIVLTNEYLKLTITREQLIWRNEDDEEVYDFDKKLLINLVKEINHSDYITSFKVVNAPLVGCDFDSNQQFDLKTFIKFDLINETDLTN